MNGLGESLAELGQGGAAALAAEPMQSSGGEGHTHETSCLNCGTALVGSHCHACGQAAHVHRTLGAFFHDLLHGVFHFEGKVWRTLPLLAWRPGQLTREYVDGRRASYVSPIALFLFGVFLMFAVFHATESHDEEGHAANVQGLEQNIARLEREIADLRGKQAQARASGRSSEALEDEIESRQDTLDTLRDLDANIGKGTDGASPGKVTSDFPQIDRAIRKFNANPDLATYKLQTYAYKYSWALIPISVPFLWLLFPFSRRFHLYDHTVFVTYSLCFMTLLLVVAMIGGAVGAGGLVGWLVFLPPIHMYRQLRGAYGLGRVSALFRSALLILFAGTALLMFFLMIMAQTSF
ncbi:DUF3667 domain-containing protein [Novosphingobium soli]|uniref:DUF3667 domain-containing protein n=1 Tax=Novosphingobium soli TaxID=574956 RepID=A0ABV6CUG9_9SPHN